MRHLLWGKPGLYQLVKKVILSVDMLAAQDRICRRSAIHQAVAPPRSEELGYLKEHSPFAGITLVKFKRCGSQPDIVSVGTLTPVLTPVLVDNVPVLFLTRRTPAMLFDVYNHLDLDDAIATEVSPSFPAAVPYVVGVGKMLYLCFAILQIYKKGRIDL
jgi:hypothetical protein